MSPTNSRKTTKNAKSNAKTRKQTGCSCGRSKLNAVSAPAKKPKKASAGKKAVSTRARNQKRLETVRQERMKLLDAYRKHAPDELIWHPDIVIAEEDVFLDPLRKKYKLSVNVPNEEVIKKLTNEEFSEYKAVMREVINQTEHPDKYHHYDILMPYGRTAKVRRL